MGSAGVNGVHDRAVAPGPGVVLGRSGASYGQAHYVDQDYWPHNTALYVTDFRGNDPRYVFHLLDYIDFSRFNSGGAQQSLNRNFIAGIEVPCPDLDGQQRIAAVLDDADMLVASLQQQLAKKRDIKQGMMQELLTGRTRLSCASGEWRTLQVAAESHLKARIGWQGLSTQEYRSSGEYRLVGGTDFRSGRVDWNRTPFVDKWRFDQDAGIQLQRGDVLLTKDGTIGKVAFVDSLPGPATLNSGVFVLRPKRSAYEPEFLYWMLRSRVFERFVAGLSAGSTITHLYQRDLVALGLSVPPTREEQRAIAAALSAVDAEIAALERRIESARAVKTGMMQELLTGRTRLPVEAAS